MVTLAGCAISPSELSPEAVARLLLLLHQPCSGPAWKPLQGTLGLEPSEATGTINYLPLVVCSAFCWSLYWQKAVFDLSSWSSLHLVWALLSGGDEQGNKTESWAGCLGLGASLGELLFLRGDWRRFGRKEGSTLLGQPGLLILPGVCSCCGFQGSASWTLWGIVEMIFKLPFVNKVFLQTKRISSVTWLL